MPTVTFCNELNDNKIGYPSYVPRATHRFTFDSMCVCDFAVQFKIPGMAQVPPSLCAKNEHIM